MNSVKDERITSQVHKIGYESFFVLIGLLFLSIIYKTLVRDESFQSFQWELFLISVSCSYYILRCIVAGIYVMPSNSKDRGKFLKSSILWMTLGSMLWGLFLAIRNTFLYQDGIFSWMTAVIFLISSIFFFILLLVAFVLSYTLSGARSSKNSDE